MDSVTQTINPHAPLDQIASPIPAETPRERLIALQRRYEALADRLPPAYTTAVLARIAALLRVTAPAGVSVP